MRPGDHIVVARVDLDVVNGDGRQPDPEKRPVGAPVDRRERAVLCSHNQHVRVGVVLAHDVTVALRSPRISGCHVAPMSSVTKTYGA